MNKKQNGFSLVEVLIVMTIVVALSAGGLYGWQQWQQQQRLWITVQQVRNLLERLRSDASWHNQDRLLALSQTGAGWCLGLAGPQTGCGSSGQWQLRQPFADVRIAEMTAGLGFYGLRNTAWPGHITLSSPAGTWQVIVSAWGRIRICTTDEATRCL
ncbi:prepilin peptidase-dependent protein [Dryocola clanedunensis]